MSLVTTQRTFAGYEGINLNTVGAWVDIDVSQFTFASVSVWLEPGSASWTLATVLIQRSADGIHFFGFGTSVSLGGTTSSGSTFTAGQGGVTGILDVSGYTKLRAYVSAAENATATASVTFSLKQTNTTAAGSGAVSP